MEKFPKGMNKQFMKEKMQLENMKKFSFLLVTRKYELK